MNTHGAMPQLNTRTDKPCHGKPIKKWPWPFRQILTMVAHLYDNRVYHWIVSIPLAPLDTVFGFFYTVLNAIWPIRYWREWQDIPQPKFPLPREADDIPVQPEACDACGKYLTSMVGLHVDADRLAALLPPGLTLDPDRIHKGKHPLVLIFGYTQDLRRIWWPLPGMSYLEFLVGIPNIMLVDKEGNPEHKFEFRFFYIPLLHLSRFYPTLIGWLVGYRKRWSRVTATENSYTVKTLFLGRDILHAEFGTKPVPAELAAVASRDTERWSKLLNQPNVNPFGDTNLFLHFHWGWADAKQKIEPITATVTVYQGLPGLPPGKYDISRMDVSHFIDLEAPPAGGVRFCSPFELLPPFSKKLLERHQQKIKALAEKTNA